MSDDWLPGLFPPAPPTQAEREATVHLQCARCDALAEVPVLFLQFAAGASYRAAEPYPNLRCTVERAGAACGGRLAVPACVAAELERREYGGGGD